MSLSALIEVIWWLHTRLDLSAKTKDVMAVAPDRAKEPSCLFLDELNARWQVAQRAFAERIRSAFSSPFLQNGEEKRAASLATPLPPR